MNFDTLMNIIKPILGILPSVLLCLLISKINLGKPNRSKQFFMPIIALLYCILIITFFDKVLGYFFALIAFVGRYLPIVLSINWDAIMTYLVNVIMIIGFILVKLICLPLLTVLFRHSGKVLRFCTGFFYEYEEDVDKNLLRTEMANIRGYFRGFYYALIVAVTAVFLLSQYFPDAIFFKAVYYPFVGVIILGEVVFFLSGMTKGEFIEDILGEDEESYRVANYGMLRSILRELFGERVLYEDTVDIASDISDTFDVLEKMAKSDDASDRVISAYFEKLKDRGEEIDINYINSCANLMRGNSTLIGNPFYSDLTAYIALPMAKQLISYKKCLVVVGRDSSATDVKEWLDGALAEFAGTESLWSSEIVGKDPCEADIGIVKFSDIYNLHLHSANRDFLRQVGFVLIIEPSRILASGQIGLSLLVSQCEAGGGRLVYCACDRNCDGLVDALSHVLKTSITEVTATLPGAANTSRMYWNADGKYMHHKIFPDISRYLGVGTEINSVAIKHQIENTQWIGSEKFPVLDMKWIAGQYYRQICEYANLPISQDAFNRSFGVETNIWKCDKNDNSFIVVEDEFQNLFEITRVYASRSKNQGFVNVVSENYFLRDYMMDNVRIFSADPKAIPTIVPDFARTERNTVLKLIMLLANEPVSEERIKKELTLCAISFEDAYEKLKELIIKHTGVDDASLTVSFREIYDEDSLSGTVVKFYEINETNALYSYASLLGNAYYVAEDEVGGTHHIGAKLYGHVFQAFLPGQFMTFDGKYYEIRNITPENGVLVRRAADHINDRKYYRQIRHIKLENYENSTEMAASRSVSGLEISSGFADISVATDGYLDMSAYGDFKNAKKVLINNIPSRHYKNKSVLRIKLPGSSEQVRYTICLLLNEIFRTTYPTAHGYIAAVMPTTFTHDGNMEYALYSYEGECEDECFYIIEDSDIDLGLIVSAERNLSRYFGIISDVLCWHTEKMAQTDCDEEDEEEYVPVFEKKKKKKKGLIARIKERLKGKKGSEEESEPEDNGEEAAPEAEGNEPSAISEGSEAPALSEGEDSDEKPKKEGFWKRLFGRKRKKGKETQAEEAEPAPADAPENGEEPSPEVSPISDGEEPSDKTSPDDTDITPDNGELSLHSAILREVEGDIDIEGEDEELSEPGKLTKYQEKCFLKFGYENFDPALDIAGTIEYLAAFGFDKNPLQQVRKGDAENASAYDPQKYGVHYCDFCGVELAGTEFDVLKDGRERCGRCSMTAIKTGEEFKTVFKNVMRNMEIFYGIKINVAIKVRMTNAKKIAKHVGQTFVTTPGFDGRTLGFAKKDRTGYSIYVENSSPRLAAVATLAHELTHIWQYLNWNDAELTRKYGKANMLEIYEGMAKWAELQYLILLGESDYAKRQEITTRMRDDEYGRGFIKYAQKYPLTDATNLKKTPFKENPPL